MVETLVKSFKLQ